MSWGERSCTQFGSCKHGPTMLSCNVDCQFYVWNGKTKPDSEKTLQTIPGSSPRTAGIKLPTVKETRAWQYGRDDNHPNGFINRMDEP